jgi:hypothetical protein
MSTIAAAAAVHPLAAPLMLVTTAHPNFAEHPAPNGHGVHPMLGRLIQPRHTSSIEATGAAGIPWAADNDCFQGLDPAAYIAMLDRIAGVPGCLFVTVPDVVADAQATAEQFDTWAPELETRNLPLALVLQDGVDELEGWLEQTWPRLAAVFIGGSDDFKLGPIAAELAREAKRRGLWVHWGRVNSKRRIRHIAETGAADSFDGSPWATLRLAAVNQRTIDRARAAGRAVPAAIRKLDQGLAWCLEVAREAAAQAATATTPAGRPVIAGGSPELDLDPITRAAIADYNVLAAYDLKRIARYGDMAASRRSRELDRLARNLIDDGVPVDSTGHLPTSTTAELAAAFERVARPRVRRLQRETSLITLEGGHTLDRRTRYNGTSLDTWRELERELGIEPPA